jgi:hypothetical protein
MFPNERDSLVYREHYKDLLREAEKARLARQARAGQERRDRFYRRPVAWLGGPLVIWGWRLQERYGAATGTPALEIANRAP